MSGLVARHGQERRSCSRHDEEGCWRVLRLWVEEEGECANWMPGGDAVRMGSDSSRRWPAVHDKEVGVGEKEEDYERG